MYAQLEPFINLYVFQSDFREELAFLISTYNLPEASTELVIKIWRENK